MERNGRTETSLSGGELYLEAGRLVDQGRLADAEETFAAADRRLWSNPPTLLAVTCRNERAAVLLDLGQDEDALRVIKTLVENVGVGATFREQPHLIVSSIAVWLFLLDRLHRVDEAAVAAELVIGTYAPGQDLYEWEIVGRAYRLRGIAAHQRGDRHTAVAAFADAIRTCDAALDRTGTPAATQEELERVTRGRVEVIRAEASLACARVLAEMRRHDESKQMISRIIERLGAVSDPRLSRIAAEARVLERVMNS